MLSSYQVEESPRGSNVRNPNTVENYYNYYDSSKNDEGPQQLYTQPVDYSSNYNNFEYYQDMGNNGSFNQLSKEPEKSSYSNNFYSGYPNQGSYGPTNNENNSFYQYPQQQSNFFDINPSQPVDMQTFDMQCNFCHEAHPVSNQYSQNQQQTNTPYSSINNQTFYNDQYPQQLKNQPDYNQSEYNQSDYNQSSFSNTQRNFYNDSQYSQPSTSFQQNGSEKELVNLQYSYEPDQNESNKVMEKHGSNDYNNSVQKDPPYCSRMQYEYEYGGLNKEIGQQMSNFSRNYDMRQFSAHSTEIEVTSLHYSVICNEPSNSRNKYSETAKESKISFTEILEKLYSNLPLCPSCLDTIEKHFNVSGSIDELKKLLSETLKVTKSKQEDLKEEVHLEPSKLESSVSHTSGSEQAPSDVSIGEDSNIIEPEKDPSKTLRDTDSTIYEGHPTKKDKESVQNLVEDKCSRCGGWTLVREEAHDDATSSANANP